MFPFFLIGFGRFFVPVNKPKSPHREYAGIFGREIKFKRQVLILHALSRSVRKKI